MYMDRKAQNNILEVPSTWMSDVKSADLQTQLIGFHGD